MRYLTPVNKELADSDDEDFTAEVGESSAGLGEGRRKDLRTVRSAALVRSCQTD